MIAREAANQGPRNPFSSCYIKDRGQYDRLRSAASKVQAKALSNCLMAGVGFHNAAMEAGDREVVEALFLARDLLVLCCTSTLAQGVNLPCHLVILKGVSHLTLRSKQLCCSSNLQGCMAQSITIVNKIH